MKAMNWILDCLFYYLFLSENYLVATPISQTLLDALNKAEASADEAKNADTAHQQTIDTLTLATKAEEDAGAASLTAHKTALDDANAAIDAVKAEFGIK